MGANQVLYNQGGILETGGWKPLYWQAGKPAATWRRPSWLPVARLPAAWATVFYDHSTLECQNLICDPDALKLDQSALLQPGQAGFGVTEAIQLHTHAVHD